ncbi:aminodeoxychorismate synthase component I [Desulfovirgula thermocuniculi]|uniref:aminodeoxychorismate synthase component I n=1 Tax=Desulfovirgula thermocuniculi TaxID=348842 RepID=UPI0004093F2A|nr:aminodeoxychorismate synthase component I [Desulfovirgula thermocuniculi]
MPFKPPLVEKVPLPPDVVALFERLADLPYSFLLDSALLMPGLGRYSIMGADPFLVLRAKGKRLRIQQEGKAFSCYGHPLEKLRELLILWRLDPSELPFPFAGGAVGYFSYDLGRLLERLPSLAADDLLTPDLCLGFYDTAAVVDRLTGEVWLVSTGLPEREPPAAKRRAAKRLEELKSLLSGRASLSPGAVAPKPQGGCPQNASPASFLEAHFDEDGYCRAVERAREYIAAGDIFVVNLSQRFSLPCAAAPWTVYKRLREISPAPMAAYLNFGEFRVACSSMERFLHVIGRRVETRPIKGTRPRGKDPASDARLREELWNSEKERAELAMIVDMERNDLGRVCRPGSVRVPELYRLEEYATVFHLVSTVEGELAAGKDVVDLLAATFPGGSITGAPKVRAMEIIEELEPVRRGIYTGSIGYLSFDGKADLNIVIRTLIFKGDRAYLQVGGGITYDSDPRLEYAETLDKARALVRALGLGDPETLRLKTLTPYGERYARRRGAGYGRLSR